MTAPPPLCPSDGRPGLRCLYPDQCPYAAYTPHEQALCYIDDASEAVEIISLATETLPDHLPVEDAKLLWKKICAQKIDEAYKEFMRHIQK